MTEEHEHMSPLLSCVSNSFLTVLFAQPGDGSLAAVG